MGTRRKIARRNERDDPTMGKRSGKYYKEEFAKACNEGIAAADAGQVKRWLAKEGVVHEGQTFAAAMAAALKSKDQPKE